MTIPVTIVSGFLGAGKSSLIGHLLENPMGRRLAVLVNDFGEISVDGQLLADRGAPVVSLANGCVCCSTQGGLLEGLRRLLADGDAEIDHVIIEASGLALPGNIVRSLQRRDLADVVHVDATVVVVDAANIDSAQGASLYLAREQLAEADIVVVNKADVATLGQIDGVRSAWIEPRATVVLATRGRVPPELLLGVARQERSSGPLAAQSRSTENFSSWTWRPHGRVDAAKIRSTLADLPESCRRVKGFVDLAAPEVRALVQVVGQRVDLRRVSQEVGSAALVVIDEATSSRAELTARLDSCLASAEGRRV